jgi:hypothetical protein
VKTTPQLPTLIKETIATLVPSTVLGIIIKTRTLPHCVPSVHTLNSPSTLCLLCPQITLPFLPGTRTNGFMFDTTDAAGMDYALNR